MKTPFTQPKLEELPIFAEYKQRDGYAYLVVRNGPSLAEAKKEGWKPVARYVNRTGQTDERLVACERPMPKES